MISLYKEPRVDVIQYSMPTKEYVFLSSAYSTVEKLGDQASPEGIHKVEHDATVLEVVPIFAGRACYQSFGSKAGRKTAEEYFKHILDVKHYSILEHSSVTFYLQQVSRSFTHELVRHRIASYSQLSQRFVAPEELGFVIPPLEREILGIEDEYREFGEYIQKLYQKKLNRNYEQFGADSFAQKKMAREAARAVLPNCTETKIVVTMNLRSLLEMFEKRNNPAADKEIHQVTEIMNNIMKSLAPNIFKD